MNEIIEYSLRVIPAILLVAITYVLMPKKNVLSLVFLLIFGFVVLRDAMTPLGFWRFGVTDTSLWLRFTDNALLLIGFGITSLLVVSLILLTHKDLRELVKWGDYKRIRTYAMGLLGAVIIIIPFMILNLLEPISERGGHVAAVVLPSLFVMAIAGNFLEEILFRGFLQGYYEKLYGVGRAVILSALIFAVGHTFLAVTVTDIGWPILAFVLYEGFICAVVRSRYGVIASTLSHGLAIFLLASGLH